MSATSDLAWEVSAPVEARWLKNLDFDPGIVRDAAGYWFQGSFHRNGRLRPEWRRYAGPDQHNLRRLANATLGRSFAEEAQRLGPGFGGWWAAGIWPAPDGRWYTTVHAEYAYLRPRGPSYAHSRRIYSAVSDDRGATWSLIGPIVASDPLRPGPARERWLDFGDGDQKMVVDPYGGFFYLYFLDGWMDTEEFTLGAMTMRVARCSMRETDSDGRLMPSGSWVKWNRGAWSEPALGGRASPIWAAPHGVGSNVESGGQPTIFFSAALGRFVAIGNGWISSASDLARQDWTPPDYSWPGKHLWYSWAVDSETGERQNVGERLRLYSARTTDRAIAQDVVLRLGSGTAAPNLVRDHSFESGTLADWHWRGDVAISEELVMSGDYAACLRQEGSFISQRIANLVGGATYRVIAWVALCAGTTVHCQVLDKSATVRSQDGIHFHGQPTGRPAIEIAFTVPSGVNTAQLQFAVAEGAGPVYIDEVLVYPINAGG